MNDRTLYVVPIEPLEERYSADWLKWTQDFLKKVDMKSLIIMPDYSYSKIKTGQFLDSVQTNVFKAKQLAMIMQLFHNGQVKNGDIFWFHDLWFPGIEMLSYIRDTTNLNIKIYGMLHAGTYDPNDFLTQCLMEHWALHFERMLLRIAKGIFVATNYHKQLFIKERSNTQYLSERVHVVPFPMYHVKPFNYVPFYERENIIIFPHRLVYEKGEIYWHKLKELGKTRLPDFQFMATKELCQNKQEYYDLLCRAKYAVSFAKQETWGIAMQEAVLCGCVPIVPNKLAYKEMYADVFKYSTNRQVEYCMNKIEKIEHEQGNFTLKYVQNELEKLQHLIIQRGNMAFEVMFDYMMK